MMATDPEQQPGDGCHIAGPARGPLTDPVGWLDDWTYWHSVAASAAASLALLLLVMAIRHSRRVARRRASSAARSASTPRVWPSRPTSVKGGVAGRPVPRLRALRPAGRRSGPAGRQGRPGRPA